MILKKAKNRIQYAKHYNAFFLFKDRFKREKEDGVERKISEKLDGLIQV